MDKNQQGTGFNYAQIVQASRVLPETPQGQPSAGTELPPTVRSKKAQNKFFQTEAPEDKPGLEVVMQHHSKVFVVWRPWEECERCHNMISQGETAAPPLAGDLECPHNQQEEYKAIVDMSLRGEYIITVKDMFMLPNGTRCVHLEWMEPDEARMQQKEREAKEKRKNRVFPPDVAGAFSKDREPKK